MKMITIKGLGGFQNFKKSIFFFAYLIMQYVWNIRYYMVLELTTLCNVKKNFFYVLFECKSLIAFFSKLYFWNR